MKELRERQRLYLSLICGYTNITKKNENHRCRKLVVTSGERKGGRSKIWIED